MVRKTLVWVGILAAAGCWERGGFRAPGPPIDPGRVAAGARSTPRPAGSAPTSAEATPPPPDAGPTRSPEGDAHADHDPYDPADDCPECRLDEGRARSRSTTRP